MKRRFAYEGETMTAKQKFYRSYGRMAIVVMGTTGSKSPARIWAHGELIANVLVAYARSTR